MSSTASASGRLSSFATYPQPGAALGIVSGRRRQGKSYLLQALAEACEGFYFAATEATEAESLRLFTDTLIRYTGRPVEVPFRDWNDAIGYLFRQFTGRPVVVVIDEFPFLSKVSPALPSIIQRELGPGGSGSGSSVRLLLGGSAMSVMGKLLAGQAPLRGRAGLELVVKPFGYRAAAEFWGIGDSELALRVHAILGGTPAYRREFTRGDAPRDRADFDDWVTRTVLDPPTPLFREARYLLAEESDIRDTALYPVGAWHRESVAGLIVIDSPFDEPSEESVAGQLRRQATIYPTKEAICDRFRTVPEQVVLLLYVARHVAGQSVRRIREGWVWKFDTDMLRKRLEHGRILPVPRAGDSGRGGDRETGDPLGYRLVEW